MIWPISDLVSLRGFNGGSAPYVVGGSIRTVPILPPGLRPSTAPAAGSSLGLVHQLQSRVSVLEGESLANPLRLIWRSIDDLPPSVAGVRTIPAGIVEVRVIGTIDLGTDRIETSGGVVFVGSGSFLSLLQTAHPGALVTITATGSMNFDGLVLANTVGSIFAGNLGAAPTSVLSVFNCFLQGFSIGTISGATRIRLVASVFYSFAQGITLDGTIGECIGSDCAFEAAVGAPAYSAITVAPTATLVASELSLLRVTTYQSSDAFLDVSPSATVTNSMRVEACPVFGPGSFFRAGSRDQTSPQIIAVGNVGTLDSAFTAHSQFSENTTATVIAAQNVDYTIGTGAPSHPLFAATPSFERFTLSGAQTQTQVVTCNALLARRYAIRLDCVLDKVSGSAIVAGLAIRVNGSVIASSRNAVTVANSGTTAYTRTSTVLSPGANIDVVIRNQTSATDIIVSSAYWSIEATG